MTPEEVIDFFAPQSSTIDAVTEWLVESGISVDRFAISANKQVLPLEHDSKTFESYFLFSEY